MKKRCQWRNYFFAVALISLFLMPRCSAPPADLAVLTGTPTLPDPAVKVRRMEVTPPLENVSAPTREPTAPYEAVTDLNNSNVVNYIFQETPTLLVVGDAPPQSVQYDVPFRSQAGLKYKGVATTSGCTAASAQMILDFWKLQDPENKTLSAQRLIDINVSQGTFNRVSGLSATNLADEFALLGYRFLTSRNGSKEKLLSALDEFGPQAVLVKTEWVPIGANHLVVLTGYDAENDLVTINDPWYDAPLVLEWAGFDGIWSLNYSEREGGYLVRTFFTVIPESLVDQF